MATYYVSTTGDNGNPGTIGSPWATWDYGFNQISAGDILYIRGGTYTPTTWTTASSRHSAVRVNSKNGSSGNLYQVLAYPGETPILDCRNITDSTYDRLGILILDSSYWYLEGLYITRVDQPVGSPATIGGQGIQVWGISDCHHVTVENCKAYNIGGPGMGVRQYVNEILFLNCDAYDNYDAYSSSPGGNADGFDIGYVYSDGIVRLTGCRAWHNGDDGYDMYQGTGYTGIYYLTNCWAWHHGYGPSDESVGDGSGFKLGGPALQGDGTVRRFLYNCISYDNRTQGYTQNTSNAKSILYNCIAYDNGTEGYDFRWENQFDVLINCISYSNGSSDNFLSNVTETTNSWQGGISVSAADFVSVTGSQLEGTRQSGGGLPVMTFLHLVAGSDMISAGTATGETLDGDSTCRGF